MCLERERVKKKKDWSEIERTLRGIQEKGVIRGEQSKESIVN